MTQTPWLASTLYSLFLPLLILDLLTLCNFLLLYFILSADVCWGPFGPIVIPGTKRNKVTFTSPAPSQVTLLHFVMSATAAVRSRQWGLVSCGGGALMLQEKKLLGGPWVATNDSP